MKRIHFNALIDAIAFVAFLLLLSTGLLLAHQLPPGSGGREGFGTGHGASERTIQLLWGWTRHEWGQIHYWIAYAMMAVLALHLVLHWKWIVSVVRGKPSTASGYRLGLGCVGLVFTLLLTAAPLMSSTESASRSELAEPRTASDAELYDSNSNSRLVHKDSGDESIRGSMTLQEIADASGVPLNQIVETLGLPADVDATEKAGRLMRRYNMQISDLRDALNRLRDNKPSTPSK